MVDRSERNTRNTSPFSFNSAIVGLPLYDSFDLPAPADYPVSLLTAQNTFLAELPQVYFSDGITWSQITGLEAIDIPVTPIVGNTGTTVQGALENLEIEKLEIADLSNTIGTQGLPDFVPFAADMDTGIRRTGSGDISIEVDGEPLFFVSSLVPGVTATTTMVSSLTSNQFEIRTSGQPDRLGFFWDRVAPDELRLQNIVGFPGAIAATVTLDVSANATIDITPVSDIQLKDNIQDMPEGLAAIRTIQPKQWEWKDSMYANMPTKGFVAQELEQGPFSGVVKKMSIPDADDICTIKWPILITAALVNAVKELADRLEILESK